MSKRIFSGIFFTILLIIICAMFIITGLLYYLNSSEQTQDLKEEIVYIKGAIEENGIDFAQKTRGNLRITVIEPDGTVLFDSSQRPQDMENHSNREEIMQALENGEGEAVRYSSTLGEKMIYATTLLSNGNVLRIATFEPTILDIIVELAQTYLIIIVFTLVVSFIVARYMSVHLLKPIINIDLDEPKRVDGYEELDPLIDKIGDQRKKISEQLENAKKKQKDFETITKNTQEGILITDENGVIISSNQIVTELLGIRAREGESIFNLDTDKLLQDNISTALEKALKLDFDIHLDERVIEVILSPVVDNEKRENQEVSGLIVLLIDTTEKARRERLRREYISDISHELKTPLTSILGYAEIIKDGIVKNEDLPVFSNCIYEEALQLKEMVKNLSDISKLEEGKKEILEKVDLNKVVLKTIERLDNKAKKSNVEVKTEFESEDVKVLGNNKVLSKLLYNLVDNAIKYNHSGGEVIIGLKCDKNETVLFVKDTGCGIAPGERERVFERFYRTDKSRSKEVEGTGLGLAIVKHAAAYCGARVDLTSEVGAGTTVYVYFPRI